MNVVIIHGPLDRGALLLPQIRLAEAVVRNHHDGMWSLLTHPAGHRRAGGGRELHRVPWDRLPSDVKRAARP